MSMLSWLAFKGEVTRNSQLLQGTLTHNSWIRKGALNIAKLHKDTPLVLLFMPVCSKAQIHCRGGFPPSRE